VAQILPERALPDHVLFIPQAGAARPECAPM
jgi:hypothetical protein